MLKLYKWTNSKSTTRVAPEWSGREWMGMAQVDGAKCSYPSWASNWGLFLMMRTGDCMAWRERRGEERTRWWEGLWKGLVGRRTTGSPRQILACQENIAHNHTHVSHHLTLWACVCVRIWEQVSASWSANGIIWICGLLWWGVLEVLQMAGEQQRKA